MEAVYPYALIVHLFCAIFFVGFLFSDLVVISYLLRHLPKEQAEKASKILGNIETKVMPPCFFLLILSGGMLLSQHIGGVHGYFESAFQKVLLLKVALAGCIFALVIFSLTMYFIVKKPNPLGAYTHKIVFVIGVGVVFLAKFAYVV
ncbi:copper resistance protein CopD [Helicobacter sp. MIT 00-7814]|uniref:copper resistance protein CopD n=1 Tax=unclassified Helicobacter TaxID=2593540 RepID=UPI000E1EC75C|nr:MULTISPECIES: copper resistance protein CopD [unclassified Helicobacter]RDU56159.1 copper resistance protein CopD [Helicobacter sp. MIT 99-10781]RDU56256.1 copper resistance protein CopD [Helicobacter sp. MIT 00-7814]